MQPTLKVTSKLRPNLGAQISKIMHRMETKAKEEELSIDTNSEGPREQFWDTLPLLIKSKTKKGTRFCRSLIAAYPLRLG